MIQLRKLNNRTVRDIIKLEVEDSQKDFVAPNSISIIDAYTTIGTECTAFPFGIYDDETPVGFVMIGYNDAVLYEVWDAEAPEAWKNNYSIWRFMIDKQYQRKGYGRTAIKLALDFIKTWPCGKAEYCALSYEPENEVARRLYASFGFVETGEMDGNEIIAMLKL